MIEQFVVQAEFRVVVVIERRAHAAPGDLFYVLIYAHLQHLCRQADEDRPNALNSAPGNGRACGPR